MQVFIFERRDGQFTLITNFITRLAVERVIHSFPAGETLIPFFPEKVSVEINPECVFAVVERSQIRVELLQRVGLFLAIQIVVSQNNPERRLRRSVQEGVNGMGLFTQSDKEPAQIAFVNAVIRKIVGQGIVVIKFTDKKGAGRNRCLNPIFIMKKSNYDAAPRNPVALTRAPGRFK